ncbi:MAG: hypothetical protein ACTSW4_05935 [Candidatus Ranarchaeia archaeon]
MKDPSNICPRESMETGSSHAASIANVNHIKALEVSLWQCLGSRHRETVDAFLAKWQRTFKENVDGTLTEILKGQIEALKLKSTRQFGSAITRLVAATLFFIEQGDLVRAFYALLDVADIMVAMGQQLLGENLVKEALRIQASMPMAEWRRLLQHLAGLYVLWSIASPLSIADFSKTARTARTVMGYFQETIRGRIRKTDGYRITRIWLEAVKQGDQLVFQALDTLPSSLPDSDICSLRDRLHIWEKQYLVIRDASQFLKLL